MTRFLWIQEGFNCLVFEKGCMVHKAKKEMTLQQMIFKCPIQPREQ